MSYFPAHRLGFARSRRLASLCAPLLIVCSLCALASSAYADGDDESRSSASPSATPSPDNDHGPTFADAVTVTASRSEQTVGDTPGSVSVINAETIERLGMDDVQDLLLFEPGVYAESDPTRLGLGGFNIRGIGENRVLTQIDGVPTAERFDFGPFTVPQYAIDVDALASVEIVRSAGSSLYGSDALGGVVSLVTRDPSSYLSEANGGPYLGLKVAYDGRDSELRETATMAAGNDRWQGSLQVTHRDGEETDNQGRLDTTDPTRTRPNPIDRRANSAFGKITHQPSARGNIEWTAEWFDGDSETSVLSGQGTVFGTQVVDLDAVDTQQRLRLSMEHSLQLGHSWVDTLFWRVYGQDNETEQRTQEARLGFRGPTRRQGLLRFEQTNLGAEVQLQKGWQGTRTSHLLTYGATASVDTFDGLRDRSEIDAAGLPVPTSLIFPTKYFPESDVRELGMYVQDEITLAGDRIRVVPGLRFDAYRLDASGSDTIFLAGNPGTEEPADVDDSSISPKLGVIVRLGRGFSLSGQFARGFRAPPFSAVNNGFTNFAGGYRTLPNPDLDPETSDNVELGLRGSFRRGSFSIAAFDNRYDDFIETDFLGFNPILGLAEFQPRNVEDVSIRGIELRGDLRLGDAWAMRGSFATIDGNNESDDQPLLSIEPAKLTVGLSYRPPGGRWGASLNSTFVDDKSSSDVAETDDQFLIPSYELLSLASWISLGEQLWLQITVSNLSDATYWTWPNVRGRPADDPAIDRYTSPALNASASVRYQF